MPHSSSTTRISNTAEMILKEYSSCKILADFGQQTLPIIILGKFCDFQANKFLNKFWPAFSMMKPKLLKDTHSCIFLNVDELWWKVRNLDKVMLKRVYMSFMRYQGFLLCEI